MMPSFRESCCVLIALLTLPLTGCDSKSSVADSGGADTAVVSPTPPPLLRDGSKAAPLRMLVAPQEGTAEDKATAGVQPVLDALQKETGLYIEPVLVTDGYAAMVEGMATRKGDICMLGPYGYIEAKKRGAAELLAAAADQTGRSVYYSGIFARKDAGVSKLTDLKGKSVAFGDLNSTSSFNYPCAMLINAGVDPSRDLGKVVMSGSQTNSMAALAAGRVDAACMMLSAYEAGVKAKRLDPTKYQLLIKSEAIPASPVAMSPALPQKTKELLRKGYANLYKNPELFQRRTADGKKVDRYDTTVTDAAYDRVIKYTAKVTDDLKTAMLKKADTR